MALSFEERVRGSFVQYFYVWLEDYGHSFKRAWKEALNHTAECFGISVHEVEELVDDFVNISTTINFLPECVTVAYIVADSVTHSSSTVCNCTRQTKEVV